MKKDGFMSSLIVIWAVLIFLILGAGIAVGTSTIQNYRTYEMKSQCDTLDRALEMWAKAHRGVDESSIVQKDGKLIYNRKRLYPETLQKLREVQNMGYFVRNIDLHKFAYSTKDEGSKYKLEVVLPNGTTYTSPRSNA